MSESNEPPAQAAALHARSARQPAPGRGALALGAAILIWGANWPVLKIALEHITPLWLSCLRFVCGAACLLALQAARSELRLPRRGDWPFVVSVGVFQMMLNTTLVLAALTLLPAGRSAMLTYTTPLWVVPASILLFGEKAVPRRLVGVALGVLGVGVLMNPAAMVWGNARVLGANLMLLAAAFCWAICMLHLRYFRSASSTFQLAPWQMLLAVPPLAVAASAMEGPFTGDGTATFWMTLAYVGPLATAFCYSAINAASTWVPATTMSTTMLAVPVVGVLASVIALGEPLTLGLAVGSLAVIAGVAVSTVPSSSRSP